VAGIESLYFPYILATDQLFCYATSMSELVEKKEHTFTRVDKDGVLREYDMFTGAVVSTSEDLIKCIPYKYTVELGNAICQRLREGKTVQQICEERGMPDVHTLYSWRATFPDFKEKIDLAREDRADYFFNKVVAVAEESEVADRGEVPSLRLQADLYKWAAEKGAPRRYGNKVSVENKHSGEVGFYVMNTGVSREKAEHKDEPFTVEVEPVDIKEGDY
jgi:transposase-like protein